MPATADRVGHDDGAKAGWQLEASVSWLAAGLLGGDVPARAAEERSSSSVAMRI